MSKSVIGRFQIIAIGIVSIVLAFFTDGRCLEVSGTLQSGDWTIADSPVIVTDDIILPAGAALRIEPGVEVKFDGPFQFIINGLIEAVGTSLSEITFSAVDASVDSLRWGGLRFIDSERGCKLIYCNVKDGWARGSWPDNNGGGIYIESSSVDIQHSKISHNRSDGDGGGIYCWFTQSIISNSLIVENYSNSMGGGMFIAYSSPQLNNCTIAFDSCLVWGGGLFVGADGRPSINNCIIVSNFNEVEGDIPPGDDYFHELGRAKSSQPVVSFSCIRILGDDAYGGPGNIVGDPLFINQPVGTDEDPFVPPADYHLNYHSPCIDAGDPAMSAGLELDNRINMGAYGGSETATRSVPVFSNNKTSLSFNNRRTGSQSSQELTIDNLGHSHLQIDSVVFGLEVFFPDSAKRDDGEIVPAYKVSSIAPGERLKFSIQFVPEDMIEYIDTARFYTNDTIATTEIPITLLSGTGIDPIAEYDPFIQFSQVQIGSAREQSSYIKNVGFSDLDFGSISVQGDYFDVSIEEDIVEPGDSAEVVYTFEPEVPGGAEAVASINSNDVRLSVTMRGTGAGPKMVVDTDTLFLGYVYFDGDTITHEIEVSNEGDDVLVISGAGVTTQAFSAVLPPDGISIAPEQSEVLPLKFHPPQAGETFEDVLTISSNYPENHLVQISGQGMPEPGRYVFGEVSGAWTADPDNPEDFIVLDSVLVPAHNSLSIGPGVRILFEPGGKFISEGTIRAIGTVTDSIYFLPRNSDGSDEARWQGIEIAFEDDSRLAFCVVRSTNDGLMIRESSPLIQFCTISNNGNESVLDLEEGETFVNDGGGISLENSGARISGCIIEDNIGSFGGGILVLNSKPTITNCIIRNNRSVAGGAMGLVFQASALIRSNIIYGNQAELMCGGISVINQSAPQILNNTIVGNTGCGIYAASTSIPILVNSIVWNNEAVHDEFNNSVEISDDANALISYSNIEGGMSGTGNLDTDPVFVDGANDDYHLSNGSPMIDGGNQEPEHRDYSFPPSLGSEINDIGAYGGPLGGSWNAAEFSISVFQNPAFPHWLDVTLTSLDGLTEAPICSLGIEGQPRQQLDMTSLDDHSFYGTYQASENGTLFLTVNIKKSDGSEYKTGRTYQLFFLTGNNSVTSIPVGGSSAHLEIMAGSMPHDTYILSGAVMKPVKPADEQIYISTPFFISGLQDRTDPPAKLRVKFDHSDWTSDDLSKLNLYLEVNGSYIRQNGGYSDGYVSAEIKHGGTFVLGMGKESNQLKENLNPESFALLGSFPNPFNQTTVIELKLPDAGHVNLNIFNLQGRNVLSLYDQHLEVGNHRLVWHGNDRNGQKLPSGLYWANMTSSGQSSTIKLLLLR